jgi:hypothetical protein
MAQRSLELIDVMYAVAEAAQPITGRGVGYKLFIAKLIASMATNEMQRVCRLLRRAGDITDHGYEHLDEVLDFLSLGLDGRDASDTTPAIEMREDLGHDKLRRSGPPAEAGRVTVDG